MVLHMPACFPSGLCVRCHGVCNIVDKLTPSPCQVCTGHMRNSTHLRVRLHERRELCCASNDALRAWLQVLEAAPAAPVVVIADCPTPAHLPALLASPAWETLVQSSLPEATAPKSSAQQHVNCIVHMAPSQVGCLALLWSSFTACIFAMHSACNLAILFVSWCKFACQMLSAVS